MIEKVESNIEEVNLEIVKDMCNEVIKAKQNFDINLVTLSKIVNDYLKCRYLHSKDSFNYETFIHINKVELQEDCIVINGITVEIDSEELEPSIWTCRTFVGFDELTEKWELSSLKEFHEGWMRALNIMYKTLPKGFHDLCNLQINESK